MTHLNHIKIRNARKFGENVDIDFGKGATILLAPNGTGKTTVFEAIELALTGKVDRVGHPPYALIRDLQTELDIQLTFDNNLTCKVNYQMGKDLVLSGDHNQLFGDKMESVPYLLRLTHLLEQRGKDWFVSANENDAGSKLDRLSIGRELNYIVSKKQSATTALTKEQSRLEEKLTKSKETLEEFNKQLEQKQKLLQNIELVSLSEIVSQLKKLAGSARFSIETNPEATLQSVITYYEQLKALLNQSITENTQKANQYSELDSLIQLYTENSQKLEITIKENENKKTTLSSKEEALNRNKELLDPVNKSLQDQQDTLLKLKELRSAFSGKDLIASEITYIEADIKNLSEGEKVLRERLKNIEDALQKSNKILDSHTLFDEDINKNENERNQINRLEKLQKQWTDILSKNKKIQDEIIPFIEKQKQPIEDATNTLTSELQKASANRIEKETSLNALKQASGEIQKAVSIVATNIPDAATDCPVCEAEYEPGELKKRITNALDKINPLISDAVNEEKLAKKTEQDIQDALNANKDQLKKLNDDLQKQRGELITNASILEEEINPNFPNCKNAIDASKLIEDKLNALKLNSDSLELRKASLEVKPSIESLNELKLQKAELERQIAIQEDKIKLLNEKLLMAAQSLKDILPRLENKSIENVLVDINKVEGDINTAKEQIQGFVKTKETIENEIKELKIKIIEGAELIAKIRSQQDGVQSQWSNAKLEGNPIKDQLDKAKKLLSDGKDTLNTIKVELERIDQEISRWRSTEAFQKLDKEIKDRIAPLTEDAYLENISVQVKEDDNELKDFTTKQKTLNAFFANAKKELDTIHKHVIAINPAWKSLLKRIVVDPRFSEGDLLSSGTFRNKSFAQIKTGLHNSTIDVTQIASEAQLTDLQLTFMLAMAKKHQWTPWRALLLDDPTQHHDLVHASAVFDLLRDYIVDLDFQIMMSTHDSTQANFFY
jgi:exonuclease SbcC